MNEKKRKMNEKKRKKKEKKRKKKEKKRKNKKQKNKKRQLHPLSQNLQNHTDTNWLACIETSFCYILFNVLMLLQFLG